MIKNDGGPAFSGTYKARCDEGRGPVVEFYDKGMTLRDYFAAKVMQSIFSNESALQEFIEVNPEGIGQPVAIQSYKMADAMLAERIGAPAKSADNDDPKSGEFIQYFSVAAGRWVGGKFIGMFLGRHVVGSAEGNVGTVDADQIRFAERAK